MKKRIIPVFFLCACCSLPLQAKLYKWVDENGQTHFGDRIPPKYLVKKHEVLNQNGDVVKAYKAAETPEERAARLKKERERKRAEMEKKKKQQRDRVLLDTYTTERDLIVARDSRLEAVDSQINLARSIIDDANRKITSLNKRIAALKAAGKTPPKDMFKQLENEKQQIKLHSAVIKQHQKRRKQIETQFNDYIKRFRILKAEQKAKREKRMRERGF